MSLRRDEQRSGGPDVIGEIPDVGRRRDDQRRRALAPRARARTRACRAARTSDPGSPSVTFVGKDSQPGLELGDHRIDRWRRRLRHGGRLDLDLRRSCARRRCSMSASSRIAVRLSGAALRTYSNSLTASSYRPISSKARPSVMRAERYAGCCVRPARQTRTASSNWPARRCSSASCAKAIDAGSFWIRRRSSSIRGLSATNAMVSRSWPPWIVLTRP